MNESRNMEETGDRNESRNMEETGDMNESRNMDKSRKQSENMDEDIDASELFKKGREMYFDRNADKETRNKGLKYIKTAAKQNDTEAMCVMGKLILDGAVTVKGRDSEEMGKLYLWIASNEGNAEARVLLNQYCQKKNKSAVVSDVAGPLRDFQGNVMKIDRKGIRTPVDAFLKYENGENIFALSANINFLNSREVCEDAEKLENAVLEGIKCWQGDYVVFGGQKVKVTMTLTKEKRLYDNVDILFMDKKIKASVKKAYANLGMEAAAERFDSFADSGRSAAFYMAKRWSVTSRKQIIIQNSADDFSNLEEVRNVAKHEFGHILGLGDLYKSKIDRLEGVDKGTYEELDDYYVVDNVYNLVMSDERGIISNNDIEMVLLAFSENCKQYYQPRGKVQISEAFGKGN
jgi:TPR repeat protein